MFKRKSFHVIIKRNFIEVFDLKSGAHASTSPIEPFSSERNVLHKFQPASAAIKLCFDNLGVGGIFFIRKCNIVIQQLEGTEEGLSQIEIRGLRDLAEQVGGTNVVVHEENMPITTEAALSSLSENK